MQHLLAVDHHGAIPQAVATALQLLPQSLISATIADPQIRYPTAQFTELREMTAEQAATVKHQNGRGRGRFRRMSVHRGLTMRLWGPTWRAVRLIGALALAWLLVELCCAPAALADSRAAAEHYRCDGEPLTAWIHPGAVDAGSIPNSSGGTVPGAFLTLQWQDIRLQLPRTNNAGSPSFSDGQWWWSLEDPAHPRFRLRRALGDVREFACERAP